MKFLIATFRPRALPQIVAVELPAERLRSQCREQRVGERLPAGPQERPEFPRILETQCSAGIGEDVEVIMGSGFFPFRCDAQTPGHAEMQQGCSAVELQQQVLRASTDADHRSIGEPILDALRDGPAQPALPHDQRPYPPSLQQGRDTAAGRFDFRQFRHGSLVAEPAGRISAAGVRHYCDIRLGAAGGIRYSLGLLRCRDIASND